MAAAPDLLGEFHDAQNHPATGEDHLDSSLLDLLNGYSIGLWELPIAVQRGAVEVESKE